MRRFTKMIAVFVLIAAVLVTGGCQKGAIELEPVQVPMDGWNARLLFSVTQMAGNVLSCPPTLSDFGNGVKIDKENALCSKRSVMAALKYKDETLCVVTYEGISSVDEITDSLTISTIVATDTVSLGGEQLWINGVKMKTTRQESIDLLGEPNERPDKALDSTRVYYLNKDGSCRLTLDSLFGKLYQVTFDGLDKL